MPRKLQPDSEYLTVKLSRDVLARIERYAQDDLAGRCDAVRALIESGLAQAEGVDQRALDATFAIEHAFAATYRGGAVQRRARIQCIVIDAIRGVRP